MTFKKAQLDLPRQVVEQPKISSENVQTNLGVAEEIYQNQLWVYKTGKWCEQSSKEDYDPVEPMKGVQKEMNIIEQSLPEGWIWINEWKVTKTRFSDEDGFEYAETTNNLNSHNEIRKEKDPNWNKCIRRRRWVRTRAPLSEEYAQQESKRRLPDELQPKITKNLQSLMKLRQIVETSLTTLGGADDTYQYRIALTNAISEYKKLKSETQEAVMELQSCGSLQKKAASKLQRDLDKEIETYENIFKNYQILMKKTPPPPKPLEYEENEAEIAKNLIKTHRTEVELNHELINDRAKALQNLHQDVVDVNATFKELGQMVKEQEKVESVTEDGKRNAEVAYRNVVNAEQEQKKGPCIIM